MKLYLISFFLLLMAISPVAASNGISITYQRHFDSISKNAIISPVFNSGGELSQILLIDSLRHNITLINPDGDTLDEIESEYAINNIATYHSPENDTLFIFALMSLFDADDYYIFSRAPYLIRKYIYTDSMAVVTSTIPLCNVVCWYGPDAQLGSHSGSIAVERDLQSGEWVVKFSAALAFSEYIYTMGTMYGCAYTYLRYSSNLNSIICSGTELSRTYGFFDTTAPPGFAYCFGWSDGFNDNDPDGYDWGSSGIAYGVRSGGGNTIEAACNMIPSFFAGNFSRALNRDGLICFANGDDLLHLYGIQAHCAGYRFEDNGNIALEWYRTSPAKYEPAIYINDMNKIFGLQNGWILLSIDCGGGQTIDSVKLSSHGFYNIKFEESSDAGTLNLFGTFKDTLFVYKYDELTGVSDDANNDLIPLGFSLGQNYPNPFNGATTIEYSLFERSNVTLSIYNLLGQNIYDYFINNQVAGGHVIEWNGLDRNGNEVGSGIYFYQLKSGRQTISKKMLLLK